MVSPRNWTALQTSGFERSPSSQLEATAWFWKRKTPQKKKNDRLVLTVAGSVSEQLTDSDIVGSSVFFVFFFLFHLLNSVEADEETEAGFGRERAGEGAGESKAGVKVEWEAGAEEEPGGGAEPTITRSPEAERSPDVAHKPSGAHQEGAEM